ncbi:MAG: hypothetical protein Q4C86_07355 [bacterium]|nr:hypothetical protein [bacterium]
MKQAGLFLNNVGHTENQRIEQPRGVCRGNTIAGGRNFTTGTKDDDKKFAAGDGKFWAGVMAGYGKMSSGLVAGVVAYGVAANLALVVFAGAAQGMQPLVSRRASCCGTARLSLWRSLR